MRPAVPELWDEFVQAWEDDRHFRAQIMLAVAVGLIGLAFALLEVRVSA